MEREHGLNIKSLMENRLLGWSAVYVTSFILYPIIMFYE